MVGCYVGFATVGSFATWYTSTSFLGIDLSQVGQRRGVGQGGVPATGLG